MKRTHCVAMLDNNNEIGEFMFSRASYKQLFLQHTKVR